MRLDPDIASTAGLLSDRARSTMLVSLLDSRARPASELSRLAGVTPQTGSTHLARLVEGGLLTVTVEGRHRFFRLSGPDVARLIETVGAFSRPALAMTSEAQAEARGLRYARTCYDHLAGKLAIALLEMLLREKRLRRNANGFGLTDAGNAWLAGLGIRVRGLQRTRRALVRPCPDWSERKLHLAGALGAALLTELLSRKAIAHVRASRAIRVTDRGRALFLSWGVSL